MIYLQSSIKLHPGKLGEFTTMMNEVSSALAARHGWKLLGSYATVVGRLHTVMDLWELPDMAAYQAALGDPEVMRYAPQLEAIIEDETTAFMTRLPIT